MQGRLARALKPRRGSAALLLMLALAAAPARQAWADEAAAFMARLCGHWRGTGLAEGAAVVDELEVAWTPDRQGLVAHSRATAGDAFAATTELRRDPHSGQFQATERNNGRWPLRHFRGRLDGTALHLLEVHAERNVRISLMLHADGVLELHEAQRPPGHINGAWPVPFVSLRYTRTGPGTGCAAAAR